MARYANVMHATNFYEDAPKKKFCLCLFNRATYSRSKSLIQELLKYPNIELHVVLSSALLWEEYGKASHYIEKEHEHAIFHRIEMDPVAVGHLGMVQLASLLTAHLGRLFAQDTFDAILLVADRHETLSAALAASFLHIPIVHFQGGEITGSIDDRVRNAVSKLSDYHFVSTDLSKQYLIQLGEERERIFNTGCPSLDVIRKAQVKRWTPKEKYILSVFHPNTEEADLAYEQTKRVMEATLEYCAWSGHRCYWYYPNPDPGRENIIVYLDQALKQNADLLIKAINKKPEDFLEQLGGARIVIGNSSCGIRECSYIGVPSVNIGSRQRSRERSYNVVDVGFEHDKLVKAFRDQHEIRVYLRSQLFGDGRAGEYAAAYLQRLEFSLKGPLTYPRWPEFRDKHFGGDRFHGHGKKRTRPNPGKSACEKKRQEVHP